MRMGIPENTPDSELVEKLTEKQSQSAKENIENAKLEYIFSYSTGNNGESFTAKITYDNNKKWCEQLGRYDNSYTSGERWVGLFPEKANNSIAHIRLGTSKNSVRDNFSGTCQIAQSDSFALNDDQNSSITLNCVITDAKDGKHTLTTTVAFAGTFKMKFNGNSIEYLL